MTYNMTAVANYTESWALDMMGAHLKMRISGQDGVDSRAVFFALVGVALHPMDLLFREASHASFLITGNELAPMNRVATSFIRTVNFNMERTGDIYEQFALRAGLKRPQVKALLQRAVCRAIEELPCEDRFLPDRRSLGFVVKRTDKILSFEAH